MTKQRVRTIYLGADHAAFELKEELRRYLEKAGYKIIDKGPHEHDSDDDYPDFVIPAAKGCARAGRNAAAIVLGGSGIGECIAANKVKGVRAALVHDNYTARMSREHNDANVLCLGARTETKDVKLAKKLVKIWLETPFSQEKRHKRRIKKIHDYERKNG